MFSSEHIDSSIEEGRFEDTTQATPQGLLVSPSMVRFTRRFTRTGSFLDVSKYRNTAKYRNGTNRSIIIPCSLIVV